MFNWKGKTDEYKVELITSTQKRLERRRQHNENLWELITKIFRPRRYDILGTQERGKQYGADIFDQGPSNNLAKFSGGRVGYMVNRAVPWIQFISLNRQEMELDHIKEYMQNAGEQVLYAAGRSTFYSSVVPHSLDADSIGTSVMIPLLDEKKDRVVFDVVHPRDSYIGVDMYGDPKLYHRSPLKLTRMTAEELFGADKLPSVWYKDGKRSSGLKEHMAEDKYLWAVYPNDDRIDGSLTNDDMPYKVFIILRGSRENNKSNLVYERGRDHFPIIYRTGLESGAEYGTSIAADCLTAALVLNKLGEKGIEAAHRAVDPPKVASRSIRPSLELAGGGRPGSTTWVSDIQSEGVKTWMDRLNWPITDAQMQRLDEQIKDRMFIKFFEMLSAGDIKIRTAYEVSQMMAEKATLMSTIVDTFEQACLEPSLEVLITEETKAGRMPEPPEELLISGGRVDIRYLGPLAQLQRSLLRSKGTIDALSIIQQMMEMNAQVGWKFDWLGLAEDVAIAQGMPQKHVLSDAEVDAIRQQTEAKQEMQEQALLAESLGKAVPGLSKAPEAGSPVATIQENLEEA